MVVTLVAKDADAAERLAHELDTYLEALLGKGLLAFRIGRADGIPAHLVLIEEWTNHDAHVETLKSPGFAAMQATVAPLLATPPAPVTYDIVAAGFADDDD